MKSDLSNVKVGDKIWTIQEGWTEVKEIDERNFAPIITKNGSYYTDGHWVIRDKYPRAFLENPFEITREVEEEILQSFRDWLGIDKPHVDKYLDQKYKPLPTVEEAAKKLGITVEQLKEITK